MTSSPPSPTSLELSTWATALQTRIESGAPAPFRYVTRGVAETGQVLQATFLSALLPHIPKGFERDSLVLRLVTATMDTPLAWPRRLLRLKGHRLEGRTPEMDPVEPAVWTLDLLPPTEVLPTGIVVDLVGLYGDQVLIDPTTGTLPRRAVVERTDGPLGTPQERGAAYCTAAWAALDNLTVSEGVSVHPVAVGPMIVEVQGGQTIRVAQVIVQVTLPVGPNSAPPPYPLADLAAVKAAAGPEVREAIENVEARVMASIQVMDTNRTIPTDQAVLPPEAEG